jgi:multidrug efflux pump
MNDPRFTTFFYRNNHILWLTILIIIVAGIGALYVLPRAEDPTIRNRTAAVFTVYPGATAKRVEALVTEPIETELRRAPEIKNIISNSSPGFSFIIIELKHEVTQSEDVFSRLRDYVQDARLPNGANKPIFDDTRSYAYTKIVALQLKNPSDDNWLIAKRYAKELATRLRTIAGTDKVALYGEPIEEVLIEVNPHVLANLGLSLKQLAQKIKSSDSKISAGTLSNKHYRILLEVAGGFDLTQRLRELPIQTNQGAIIHLRDIAKVAIKPKSPLQKVVLADGIKSIIIAIRMQAKQDINQWDLKIDKQLAQMKTQMPSTMRLIEVFSQQHYTNKRFKGLSRSVLLGLVSIIFILFITLGARGALIVSSALPLTILFTLFGLRLLEIDLQQITVIGLIVGLGIMIDNAIVIAESIQHKRLLGMSSPQAIFITVNHFWLPLLGATITTILAFMPILLMPGPAGEFVGGIGFSVILTLIGSYWISHTIIASLAGRFMPEKMQTSWYQIGIKAPRLAQLFQHILAWCLTHSKKSALVLLIISTLGFIAQSQLTEQFFPASGRNQINLEVYASPQQDLMKTALTIKRIDEVIKSNPNINQTVWYIGQSAAMYYYNLIERQRQNPIFAQAMITVNDSTNIVNLIKSLQTKLDQDFPESQIMVKKIDQGPPYLPIELRIYGQDLAYLQFLSERLRQRLKEIPFILHTRASLEPGSPKLVITLDEQQVHALGLSTKQLASEIQSYVDGINAGDILEGNELLPITVRLKSGARQQLSNILELPLSLVAANNAYQATPLAAIATLKLTPDWRNISRRNSRRVNTITALIPADKLPAQALTAFKKNLQKIPFNLPPGYELEIGGEKEKRDEAVGNLMVSMPLIFVLLISVLILTFKKIKYVIIILTIVTQALSMGLLSLYLSGYPFGFQVIIALIGLVGLAINASIVILSEILANPRAARGVRGEINRTVQTTLRHITSTTLTTVAGFLPLIIAGGQFWPPFAYTIAGGTVLTTFLSLFLVPVLFRVMSRINP